MKRKQVTICICSRCKIVWLQNIVCNTNIKTNITLNYIADSFHTLSGSDILDKEDVSNIEWFCDNCGDSVSTMNVAQSFVKTLQEIKAKDSWELPEEVDYIYLDLFKKYAYKLSGKNKTILASIILEEYNNA